MSIDWNRIIAEAENELAKRLTARVVSGLLAKIPWLAALGGPLSFLLGLLIGQLVKYGDWLAYYLGNGWMNTDHGKDYQKTGEALESLPPEATQEEIDAAKKAKSNAFDVLMGAAP